MHIIFSFILQFWNNKKDAKWWGYSVPRNSFSEPSIAGWEWICQFIIFLFSRNCYKKLEVTFIFSEENLNVAFNNLLWISSPHRTAPLLSSQKMLTEKISLFKSIKWDLYWQWESVTVRYEEGTYMYVLLWSISSSESERTSPACLLVFHVAEKR